MTNHWIITSALAPSGSFSQEEKFHQTLLTIDSIRRTSTDNKLILVEGSANEIAGPHRRTLLALVDEYFEHWHMEKFQGLMYVPNKERQNLKSILEVTLMQTALERLRKCGVNAPDRVFKITGRYWLTSGFDLHAHLGASGRYVFGPPGPNLYKETPYRGQMPTRLYSMCGSLLPHMEGVMGQAADLMRKCFRTGHWADLEHALCDLIDPNLVHHLPMLGVSGHLGLCGTFFNN